MTEIKVYVVGTGMDGVKTLTLEAFTIIDSADVLIGAGRMLEPFEHLQKKMICEYSAEKIADYIHNCGHNTIVVLMSGDCGFYSGAKRLSEFLDCEIVSGISTPVYFCSKIGRQWENMKFVSLHGKHGNVAVNVMQNEHCFFLLGGKITPAEICGTLCRYGLGAVSVFVGENLCYENERIISGTAESLQDIESGNLCAVITENKNYMKYIPSGIDDGDFIRTAIPMTKAEVRAVAVSKLNIGRNSICWDIGCGTGSVSVEMAVKCTDGGVYAFDKNLKAVKLTSENSEKFGCDNIHVYESLFPEDIPENIPVPNCVFIGGASGKIS
ncbi:MAG: precorrin-6y C5,15-methyltransferase (decarboxylating) subunit CbiE, partial [Ruminococcus sp.]|nr:precorrin-6y C5,15-methyltransferase (decarboxylating) subunit CbiE [Ruminococcus sp.]